MQEVTQTRAVESGSETSEVGRDPAETDSSCEQRAPGVNYPAMTSKGSEYKREPLASLFDLLTR